MGSSSIYQLPWVEPTDPMANFPAVSQDLANKVEAAMSPSPLVSDAFTSSAGWDIAAQYLYKVTQLVIFTFNGTRTGGPITVPASGDITNSQIAELDPVRFRVAWGMVSTSSFGRVMSYVLSGTGALSLSAVAGTGDIATGSPYSISGIGILK
jgi:hypothetical protein